MFESDIERSKITLMERLITAQPFVYLRDVVNNAVIEYAYKQYFDAEFSWWLYEEQMLRHSNPHLDVQDNAIRGILNDLDNQYRRTARFDREQVTGIVDAAVKSVLNYRIRPRTTLKWFVFRGEPTKAIYEVYLRMRYFADYTYLHEGFNQWLLQRGLNYDSMDIISVLEFEKLIKKLDDDTILELSPMQFVALINPIFTMLADGSKEPDKQVVPIEAIIVFLDDKEIHIIAQKLERMLYQQGVRYISKEMFLQVVDEVLNEVETQESGMEGMDGSEQFVSAEQYAHESIPELPVSETPANTDITLTEQHPSPVETSEESAERVPTNENTVEHVAEVYHEPSPFVEELGLVEEVYAHEENGAGVEPATETESENVQEHAVEHVASESAVTSPEPETTLAAEPVVPETEPSEPSSSDEDIAVEHVATVDTDDDETEDVDEPLNDIPALGAGMSVSDSIAAAFAAFTSRSSLPFEQEILEATGIKSSELHGVTFEPLSSDVSDEEPDEVTSTEEETLAIEENEAQSEIAESVVEHSPVPPNSEVAEASAESSEEEFASEITHQATDTTMDEVVPEVVHEIPHPTTDEVASVATPEIVNSAKEGREHPEENGEEYGQEQGEQQGIEDAEIQTEETGVEVHATTQTKQADFQAQTTESRSSLTQAKPAAHLPTKNGDVVHLVHGTQLTRRMFNKTSRGFEHGYSILGNGDNKDVMAALLAGEFHLEDHSQDGEQNGLTETVSTPSEPLSVNDENLRAAEIAETDVAKEVTDATEEIASTEEEIVSVEDSIAEGTPVENPTHELVPAEPALLADEADEARIGEAEQFLSVAPANSAEHSDEQRVVDETQPDTAVTTTEAATETNTEEFVETPQVSDLRIRVEEVASKLNVPLELPAEDASISDSYKDAVQEIVAKSIGEPDQAEEAQTEEMASNDFTRIEDFDPFRESLFTKSQHPVPTKDENMLHRLDAIVSENDDEHHHSDEQRQQMPTTEQGNGEILGIISRVLGNQSDVPLHLSDTQIESPEAEPDRSVLGKGLASLLTPAAQEVITPPRPSVATFVDNKQRDVFVKKLCRKDELRYDGLIAKLDRATKWKDALAFLDQFYAEEGVDPQSSTARDLRMAVYKRFVNN